MKSDKELLKFVLAQIEILITFTEGVDEEAFLRNDVIKDACLMKLIIIGEYSSKVSENMKQQFDIVEWQLLKAARNYYAHAYGGINWERVWETLSNNVPELKVKIQSILNKLN